MLIKKACGITALTLCFILALGPTVQAVKNNNTANNQVETVEPAEAPGAPGAPKHHKEHKSFNTIIKAKLQLTDADIENAIKSGKTAFDLAKTKGITEKQLKDSMLEEKFKRIDEAVKQGNIPKEKADKIKTRMKERIESWDGKFKPEKQKPINENNKTTQ